MPLHHMRIRLSSTLLSRFFDGAYEKYRRLRDEAPVYYNAKWDSGR